jgi:hypothetical protein
MAKGRGKGGGPLLLISAILLFAVLLVATGLDWYIVYLLARDITDFGVVRQYALGVGISLILLVAILIALYIASFFFGAGLAIGFNLRLVYNILIVLLLGTVGGLNLAICPIAKGLTENPDADQSPEKAEIRLYAIIGASFGTGIIALALFYYAFRGFIATKKAKKMDKQGIAMKTLGKPKNTQPLPSAVPSKAPPLPPRPPSKAPPPPSKAPPLPPRPPPKPIVIPASTTTLSGNQSRNVDLFEDDEDYGNSEDEYDDEDDDENDEDFDDYEVLKIDIVDKPPPYER